MIPSMCTRTMDIWDVEGVCCELLAGKSVCPSRWLGADRYDSLSYVYESASGGRSMPAVYVAGLWVVGRRSRRYPLTSERSMPGGVMLMTYSANRLIGFRICEAK